ncbi:MAG: SAM-dependent DNA methyltransferase [Saprospiraceae bacterium]|nr:SAM-dependent DNA methyltransferase [Candidatus Vicinibacter affinis]
MQGKQLRKLEAELWRAADQLRANSKLTASEYSMPVLGLIFLRHAYNRFQKVKVEVEKTLPSHPQRGKRPLTKKDFEEQNSMFLPEKSQFDYLVSLPESADIGEAIDNAMKLIEDEYENLKGVLPKNFSIFSKDLLRELLRIFNKEVLQKAEGDLFGKIYEYFLNKFAMTGAQEGGEFFTPMSLVQTIVNVIEPDHGIVFDPACGSAGMFVQTGYFIENEGLKPAEKVTFYGQEKAELNTKLAKMNLAVHGLEGNIQEGNTFYEDKHNLVGGADFVMANPPFNVDGVDKGKDAVKKDPRLMLDGKVYLPKNDNANYLWIQYFYNYLKPTGRAGFVMASSASDAGHSEKDIREKLVKTGAVDVMMAIGNNFFYTRSLPCTLWFFDRGKESKHDFEDSEINTIKANGEQKSCLSFNQRNRVLMLDARKIYRKVTSKVNDFSSEQLQNLICIVNLYRGNTKKFESTVKSYLQTSAYLAKETAEATTELQKHLQKVFKTVSEYCLKQDSQDLRIDKMIPEWIEITSEAKTIFEQQNNLLADISRLDNPANPIIEKIVLQTKALRKPQDKLIKQLLDAISTAAKEYQLNKNKDWKELNLKEHLDQLKTLQQQLSGNPDEEEPGLLHETEYFYKQAHWLTSRFPEGVYTDVEGLCKVVSQKEIEAKDWSLSPGRYVGVDTSTDEDIDYEERLKEIHIELEGLNEEAIALADAISKNFKSVFV